MCYIFHCISTCSFLIQLIEDIRISRCDVVDGKFKLERNVIHFICSNLTRNIERECNHPRGNGIREGLEGGRNTG